MRVNATRDAWHNYTTVEGGHNEAITLYMKHKIRIGIKGYGRAEEWDDNLNNCHDTVSF